MIRNSLFPLLIVVAIAISASAQQQRPAQPTSTPAAAAPAATVALPVSKMAVINSDAFLDQKNGIAKFNTAITKLNGEFQKIKDDLTAMQTRATTLESEITKLQQAPEGTPIDQKSLQAKIDQLEQLKKDIQRKSEDAQNSYNRRRAEIFNPLQDEIGKALEAFAKARGITVIIDAAQVPLLFADEKTDITRAFITDFNSKNPVTAASTTTPPE
ncbi:MAG TPA: OmpH family outer membrane protein [Pyrinomonadaceae bacterium]|jgi:outer membrane protein|nr:OmpH family outer membrane protein [Pyrinomonadaceae bacterium]